MKNNNEVAKEFAVWCWGKEVSSDVSKIESLFYTFLAEKERDYEILSFISVSNSTNGELSYVNSKKEHQWESDNFGHTEESLLKNKKYVIHSIKRVSDGQIFTIGDVITERLSNNKKVTISQLNIHFNELCIYVVKGSLNTTVLLSFINKIKQPLFTTVDGVEVFEGDLVYSVVRNSGICKNIVGSTVFGEDMRVFSTEIAAKNYIKENEKRFSLADIKKIVYDNGCFGTGLISILENK